MSTDTDRLVAALEAKANQAHKDGNLARAAAFDEAAAMAKHPALAARVVRPPLQAVRP